MKTFDQEEIEQIKTIVNDHLDNHTIIVSSINLTVSQPIVQFGDVGSQLKNLIVYDVQIEYGEGKILKIKNLDLSEDIRDAAAILTDKIEEDMK